MDIVFDDEFAGPADYARLFRQLGLQVVPAMSPDHKNWKRPALNNWRDYQNELVDQGTFDSWFGPGGSHVGMPNIGILTGACSGGLFVIDLDDHKGPEAQMWWQEMLDRQEKAGEIEDTVMQVTGGGGRQIFFRAPEGWTPPTSKAPVYHVDIRGQGGFVVCDPSRHESGRNYRCVPGHAFHEREIATAPDWLCEQIDILFGSAGATTLSGAARATVKTPTPDAPLHAFGGALDGREDKMTRMVWARVLDMWRDCPIGPPTPAEQKVEADELFREYVSAVHPRLSLADHPGKSRAELLEMEGRGRTLFNQKWAAAMRQWDGKVAREAGHPNPKQEAASDPADDPHSFQNTYAPPEPPTAPVATAAVAEPFIPESERHFEVLSLKNLLELPDMRWLIDGLIAESSLSFIYGAPACGKSFIALCMALALAARFKQWWGKEIEHSGPVIYIAAEGIMDMQYRVRAWCDEHGQDMESLPLHFIRQSINFMKNEDIEKLGQTVVQYVAQMKEPPCLIIIDTVSRMLPGARENLADDMSVFVNACGRLQKVFGCAVIGVHHESKGGQTLRGSSSLQGAADQIFRISREVGSMEGTLFAEKVKAEANGWEWTFGLKEVDVPTKSMKPQRSLVAYRVMDTPLPMDAGFGGQQETGHQIVDGKKWPPMDKCRDIVNAIGRAWSDKDPWSNDKKARAFGRYAPERISDAFNITVELAEVMVARWLRTDVLVVEMSDARAKKNGLKVKNGL